jgi:hypothetical protein
MVFFAFVQQYAFSSKPYSTQTNKKKNEWIKAGWMWWWLIKPREDLSMLLTIKSL